VLGIYVNVNSKAVLKRRGGEERERGRRAPLSHESPREREKRKKKKRTASPAPPPSQTKEHISPPHSHPNTHGRGELRITRDKSSTSTFHSVTRQNTRARGMRERCVDPTVYATRVVQHETTQSSVLSLEKSLIREDGTKLFILSL